MIIRRLHYLASSVKQQQQIKVMFSEKCHNYSSFSSTQKLITFGLELAKLLRKPPFQFLNESIAKKSKFLSLLGRRQVVGESRGKQNRRNRKKSKVDNTSGPISSTYLRAAFTPAEPAEPKSTKKAVNLCSF